jgi:hypothetical protein
MITAMKRAVGLVLFTACAVWGVLLLDLRGGREKRSATDAQTDASQAVGSAPHVPIAERTKLEPSAKAPAQASVPKTRAAAQESSSTTLRGPGSGDVRVIGAQAATRSGPTKPGGANTSAATAQARGEEATGELGEGIMSPDFVELEADYTQEPREGAWAIEHERRIRQLLYASELGDHIVIVHCLSTVCRIHINPPGDDPLGELLRVPGLVEHTNLDRSTPYSLKNGELIVYTRPQALAAAPE